MSATVGGHVVCFGEMLLRLSPPAGTPLARADALDLHVGGAEANVAMALAGMGHPARMVTALPPNGLGQRAIAALGEAGVDTRAVVRSAGRMGTYFFEYPSGPIPGRVTYDREHSSFAQVRPEDLRFDDALDGAALLHMSGITPALGPNGVALAKAAVDAARRREVPICFDGNYRANLWSAWDGDARLILNDLVSQATILLGNHRDISLLLGEELEGSGPERRRIAAQRAFDAYPNLELIASTARHVETGQVHRLAARVDRRESCSQTDEVRIAPIVDRVGTGDAFATGILCGWLEGVELARMAQLGLKLAAMKHGRPGDVLAVTPEEVEAFDLSGGDVIR
ncbi:sugar kinase [Erythrobacter sp. 3-20A1M]|uniref:sugar kinase n=1 Tax=Erythrobacter sp. 3-20A1M TaxID=2653850 RepID=UPI001C332D3A|nr:sugar kinase [Erythrobacter sp. 3-20A1M]QWC57432.1 sugar kinase [Erythrobacter sp. 3-20A1M]